MRPPPRHVSSPADLRVGLLAAAGAAILYGAAYPATAIALASFSPLSIAGIACTIALPLVIAAAAGGALPRPTVDGLDGPRLLRLAILSSLGGALFIAATNIAVGLSGSTVTGFVAPLYAVAAAVLAIPILGERLRPSAMGAFLLAIVGTALLAGDLPSADALAGVGMAVVAAVLFGLYMVLARRWQVRYRLDGTLITIANLISRGPILLLVEAIRSPGPLLPPEPGIAALVAIATLAVGSSSSANLLLMASVKRVPAGRTSAALLLTPISSAILSVLLLDDHLAPIQFAGAGLVLVGIAIASGLVRIGRATADEDGAPPAPLVEPPG
jgi:probable blue pigment (indigoidine) exporter